MNTRKICKSLLAFSFIMIAFIYADTYFIPGKTYAETVTKRARLVSVTVKNRVAAYFIYTNHHKYRVDATIYYAASADSLIFVQKSPITHALKSIRVKDQDIVFETDLGFISAGSGIPFTLFFGLVSLLSFIFYDKLPYRSSQRNLAVFLPLVAIGLFIFYIYNGM